MKEKELMNVKLISLKRLAAASFGSTLLMAAVFALPLQGGDAQPSDPPAYYKAKCVACHGQKAEKKFDATLTDDQMLEAVLKGKKAEKPPNMPGFEAKGVTADQAKALIAYMKQLKAAPAQ
jgi:mono/diheme cytochrome c family protein